MLVSLSCHIFSGGMASITMFYIIAVGCGAKLMWLAVQLCHLIAMGIESTFPSHSDWAAALLPKGCRLDMDSFMKQAMVKDRSQGSMTQHRLWSLAPLHKLLVRYWLAGREFLTQHRSCTLATDGSRACKKDILAGILYAGVGGVGKAVWVPPQAFMRTTT